jgi:hypothetical protein
MSSNQFSVNNQSNAQLEKKEWAKIGLVGGAQDTATPNVH